MDIRFFIFRCFSKRALSCINLDPEDTQFRARLTEQSLESNLRYVGDIQTIGVGQIDVVPRHLPTSPSKPPRDGIATIRPREIVCDIHSDRNSGVDLMRRIKHFKHNFRAQYSDRINRINEIKEKGYKYPENHVNPVKITR